MKNFSRHATKVIGPVLFGWILSRSDLTAIWTILLRMDAPLFLCALMLFYPILWIKAGRWGQLMGVRTDGNLTRFRFYVASYFAGSITPGRLGEFIRVTHARQLGSNKGQAIFSAISDRILDLSALALLGIGGLLLQRIGISNTVLLTITVAGGFWALRQRLLILADAVVNRVLANSERVLSIVTAFRWNVIGYTSMAWLLCITQIWLLASSLGIDIAAPSLIGAYALSAIAGALPISVAGVGTRDIVLIGLFQNSGASAEQALAFSAGLLAIYLIQMALSLPFWVWSSVDTSLGAR